MTVKTPDTQPSERQDPFQVSRGAEPRTDEPDGLEAHKETPYRILRFPEDREEYLHLTDNLVREMVTRETDVVIYLDKSARPVEWLVHELWGQLAPPNKPDGSAYQEPDRKFINIDREQWGAIVGRSEDGPIDVSSIPEERIDELRKIFSPIGKIHDMSQKAPDESMFSGKKIMVVDEVNNSGDTLRIAHRILERAFPDASDIQSVRWMDGQVKRDKKGVGRSTKAPVWYKQDEVKGRLVGDRNLGRSERADSTRQRAGMYWLSTRFEELDLDGIQLRRETRQLAKDLRNHRVLYRPSHWSSEIDPVADRIQRINGISPEQYKNLRISFARDPKGLIQSLGQLAGSGSESSE